MRSSLFLLFLISCGDHTGYDRRAEFPQEEESGSDYSFFSFDTRLTPDLRISGTLCRGGEVVDSEGRSYTCNADQWLVVVDHVNFCTPEGCTEVEVRPIIAIPQNRSGGDVQFFEIAPFIPVSGRVDDILDGVIVRYDGLSDPVVVFD